MWGLRVYNVNVRNWPQPGLHNSRHIHVITVDLTRDFFSVQMAGLRAVPSVFATNAKSGFLWPEQFSTSDLVNAHTASPYKSSSF